jgi:hypothetical protein
MMLPSVEAAAAMSACSHEMSEVAPAVPTQIVTSCKRLQRALSSQREMDVAADGSVELHHVIRSGGRSRRRHSRAAITSPPSKQSFPAKSVPDRAAPRDAAPRDAAPRDGAPRDAAPREEAPRDAALTQRLGRLEAFIQGQPQRVDVLRMERLMEQRLDAIEHRLAAAEGRTAQDDAGETSFVEHHESIYCFCFQQILYPVANAPTASKVALGKASIAGKLLRHTAPLVHVDHAKLGFALLSLLFLLVFQAIMGFAFVDAAVLESRLNGKNAHAEPVDRRQFYVRPPLSDTLPSASDASRYMKDNDGLVKDGVIGGGATSPVNCAASILAIILLCTGPLNIDDQQTLLTLHPLNHLLFAPWWSAAPALLVLWRILVTPLLQLLWVTRALFLPVVAGMGTALAMSHSESAVDIVL